MGSCPFDHGPDADAPAVRSIGDLSGPRGLPLVGNLLQVRPSRIHLQLEQWCREYGPIFRFDLGRGTMVGIGDSDAMSAILRDRPDGFRRSQNLKRIVDELGIHPLFTSEGQAWRDARRGFVAAVPAAFLRSRFDVVASALQRLHRRVEPAARVGQTLDVKDHLMSYTFDVIWPLACGGELSDDPPRREVQTLLRTMQRRVLAPLPYWRWLPLAETRAVDRAVETLSSHARIALARARARIRERPDLGAQPQSVIEAMVATQTGGSPHSEELLVGNIIFAMFIGGLETAATVLAWALWFLAREPHAQARLATEAHSILGDQPYPTDVDSIDRLDYTEAVLHESMRLKPSLPFIPMQALQDTTILDTHIPTGTKLTILNRHAALQPTNFSDPDRFDPGRWLAPEHSRQTTDRPRTHQRNASVPFGAGPRFCPGRNLALLETKAALAMIGANFEISLDGSAKPVTERMQGSLAPNHLRLQLRKRTFAT
jgi:cytochrome P450